jgi:hypothetical protein
MIVSPVHSTRRSAVRGHAMRRCLRRESRLSLPVLWIAGLYVPATVELHAEASQMATLVGWEFMLSSFSYLADAPGNHRSQLGRSLFFLIVSPAVVFADDNNDSLQPPPAYWRAAARCVFGLLTWCAQDAAYFAAHAAARIDSGALANDSIVALCAIAGLQFLACYWGHSGLASGPVATSLLRLD